MSNQRIQSIVLMLLAIVFFLLHLNFTDSKLTDITLGVATGLLAAFLVNLIFPGRLQDLRGTITRILEIVTQVSIRVFTRNRDKLENSKFYDEHYRDAGKVCISGIALTDFIEKLTWYQDTGQNLKEALNGNLPVVIQELRSRNIIVRALLMDPDSGFVNERKTTERNPNIHINIENNLRRLEQFKADLAQLEGVDRFAIVGNLDIRTSAGTLYFTTFQIEYDNQDRTDVLYFGLLFSNHYGNRSPLLSIYNTGDQMELYKMCRDDFVTQFDKAQGVFHWNNKEVR